MGRVPMVEQITEHMRRRAISPFAAFSGASGFARYPEPSEPALDEEPEATRLLREGGIQRAPAEDAAPARIDPGPVQAKLAGGTALSESISSRFSGAYGRDLSGVRVHTESTMARDLGARAFTVGRDVAFAPGQYRPGTPEGDRLIGHELAHVVQQAGGAGAVQGSGLGEDGFEAEADRAADAALSGAPVYTLSPVRGARVQGLGLPPAEPDSEEARAEQLMTQAAEAALIQCATGGDLGGALRQAVGDALAPTDLSSKRAEVEEKIPGVTAVRAEVGGKSYGYEDAFHLLTAFLGLPASVAPRGQGSFGVQAFATASAQDIAPYLSAPLRDDSGATHSSEEMSGMLALRVESWASQRSVLSLELDGTLQGLTALRKAMQDAKYAEERVRAGAGIGDLARRALLLDQAIQALRNAEPGGDLADASALEQALMKSADTIARIRDQATTEGATQGQLGDVPTLLRPAEVSAPDEALESREPEPVSRIVSPEEAFPRSSDAAVTSFTQALAARTRRQASELARLRAGVVPPRKADAGKEGAGAKKDETKDGKDRTIGDFEALYRRWFAFFSVGVRNADPEYEARSKLVQGVWASFGAADALGGAARYLLMQRLGSYMGEVIGGADPDFAGAMGAHPLQQNQHVDGWASEPRYRFGHVHAGASHPFDERASREEVLEHEARRTERLIAEARSKDPAVRRGAPPFEPGALPAGGPDAPLKSARARESWTYLVTRVYDGPAGQVVAKEAKLMPPEVARYLLAEEQHLHTLETPHRPGLGDTPLSWRGKLEKDGRGAASKTYLLGEAGDTKSPDIAAAQAEIAARALNAGAVVDAPPLARPEPASTRAVTGLIQDLETELDAFFATAPLALRLSAVMVISIAEFGADAKLKHHFTPEALKGAFWLMGNIEGATSLLNVFGGRVGAAISQGIHMGMKVYAVGADTPQATMATIGAFLALAGEATSLRAARVYAFFGAQVADSIGQLLQMFAVGKIVGAAGHGARAGLTKAKGLVVKTPSTPRDMFAVIEPLLAIGNIRAAITARLRAEVEAQRAVEKPGEKSTELVQLEGLSDLVSGKRGPQDKDAALDQPIRGRSPDHFEVAGRAERIPGSEFRGDDPPGESRRRMELPEFTKEKDRIVDSAIRFSGANAKIKAGSVTLKPIVSKTHPEVTVHFVLADNPMPDVAQYAFVPGDSIATVRVSPKARLQDIERAIAHELAEIQGKIDGRDAAEDALDAMNPGERLSAHDYGRLAELRVLFDQLRPTAETVPHAIKAGDRADTIREIDILLATIGLPRHDPSTPKRIDDMVKQKAIDGQLLAEIGKLNYLESQLYRANTRDFHPSQIGMHEAAPEGVAIYGTDTTLGDNGPSSPGHIMATNVRDPNYHLSFAPAELELGVKSQIEKLKAEGVDLSTVEFDRPLTPFRGIKRSGVKAESMPGHLHMYHSDYYVFQGSSYAHKPQHFGHLFDPSFLQPEAFGTALEAMRSLKLADRALTEYIVMTGMPKDGALNSNASDGSRLTIRQGTTPKGKAREIIVTRIGEQKTIQAQNCVTQLIDTLMDLRTSNGEQVLDANDLRMLGMTEKGLFRPGRDLQTQEIYEHLRWKEHTYLERAKKGDE